MADQPQAQGNQANSAAAPAAAQPVQPAANAGAAKPSMPVAPPNESVVQAAKPAPAAVPTTPDKIFSTPTAAPGVNAENKNVFTELFGNDKAQKNAAFMGSVVKQQDKKTKSFFGQEGSKLKQLKETGKKSFKVSKSTPGKLVLQVSVLAIIGVTGFFYSQNSAGFTWLGANVAHRAEIAQEQIAKVNAEIFVQQYLSAVLLLEQYASVADEYFYNLNQAASSYNSKNKREAYAKIADDLRPDMTLFLERAQGYMSDDVTPEEKAFAKTVVEDLITELHDKSGEVDEDALLQDIQDLESTKKLMQSGEFRSILTALNLDEVTDEDLETVYDSYTEISASVGALISAIKAERMMWSVYLEEIEDLTKDVDPLFGTEYNGNLTIDDVKFSTDSVLVSGNSMTDDTKNFTLVSNLIDTYEDSDLFENVEDRSYSKSEGEKESYKGNFRISMDITTE